MNAKIFQAAIFLQLIFEEIFVIAGSNESLEEIDVNCIFKPVGIESG